MNKEDLFDGDGLARRLQARVALARLRDRVRCRRCHGFIPETRRRHAVYCSRLCCHRYRREQTNRLISEVRQALRSLAPKECPCGAVIDSQVGKPGPVARLCPRCQKRGARCAV